MPNNPVLLVEDDPSDVRLMQRALETLSADVKLLRLSNGEDAIAYLSGEHPYEHRTAHPLPSVILLDLKLPRLTGLEVLQWVRSQKSPIKHLPIVILSSSSDSADVNRAYANGANSYLVKPNTAAELAQLVSNFQSFWLRLNQGPDS